MRERDYRLYLLLAATFFALVVSFAVALDR